MTRMTRSSSTAGRTGDEPVHGLDLADLDPGPDHEVTMRLMVKVNPGSSRPGVELLAEEVEASPRD